jgi:hypothetical protein
VPFKILEALVPNMNSTKRSEDEIYWHVLTKMVGDDCVLVAGEEQLLLRFAPMKSS